jgi:hypothetical protein
MLKIKEWLKKNGSKIFNSHKKIGYIFTTLCMITIAIGLIFKIKACGAESGVIDSNFFINEPAPVHDGNYTIVVNRAFSTNKVKILDKKKDLKEVNGFLICVDVTLTQSENSVLKAHKFDANDFKLKNHTGVYIPLNTILGALGWDGIDVHIDEKGGGHVMSSIDFSTRSCLKDYNFVGKTIEQGNKLNFVITFEMSTEILVENNITVLEVDFYVGSQKHRKGTDIVLLQRPVLNEEVVNEIDKNINNLIICKKNHSVVIYNRKEYDDIKFE